MRLSQIQDGMAGRLPIIDITPEGFVARALLAGISLADVQSVTGAPLRAASHLQSFTTEGIVRGG